MVSVLRQLFALAQEHSTQVLGFDMPVGTWLVTAVCCTITGSLILGVYLGAELSNWIRSRRSGPGSQPKPSLGLGLSGECHCGYRYVSIGPCRCVDDNL